MNNYWLLLSVLLLCGCTQEQPIEYRNYIKVSGDDGGIGVLKAMMPNITAGFISGAAEDAMIGLIMGGDNELLTRYYYRFNLSDWNNTDVTFHLLCNSKTPGVGALEISLVNDTGRFPLELMNNPIDVSAWWNLNSIKIVELSPQSGDMIESTITAQNITNWLSSDYITIMVKLVNEDVLGSYVLSTYDYAESRDNNNYKPYLTYE